jgi:hypothetical protein
MNSNFVQVGIDDFNKRFQENRRDELIQLVSSLVVLIAAFSTLFAF